jgi:multimeric flavodoxin WrbA
MKVVAFNGSPRPRGNTTLMLEAVLGEVAKEGIETELVQIGNQLLHGCRACGQCQKSKDAKCSIDDDPMNGYIQKMIAADAILIGSPTYFADLTSETKALIDRCGYVGRVNGDLYRRKVGAAVSAVRRAGALHVIDSISHFFTIGQMIVVGSSYWNVGLGRKAGDVEQDVEGMATMVTLGQNLAWVMKRLYGG